jgi:methyl-accepting chemotaxis protein
MEITMKKARGHSPDALLADVRRLAQGDLTVTLGGGKGQVGEIGAAINELVLLVRQLLTEADEGAHLLEVGWRSLSDVAWAMSNTAESTVGDVSAAASAAAEVSQNVQFIAVAVEETTATMREVANHASDASRLGQDGLAAVRAVAVTVEELHGASTKARGILTLIGQVAKQTHLLALNATIEAARAGDHGTGFAVVAGEVKALAEQTATASGGVARTIEDIGAGSLSAASSMGGVTATIAEMSDRQHSIAAAVEQQTVTTQAVARGTAAAATQSASLAQSVNTLSQAVRLTAYTGAKARTVAADVAAIEQSLRGVTSRFQYAPIPKTTDETLELADRHAIRENGVTLVHNDVVGVGVNEWTYTGTWGHALANLEAVGTNSHSCMPGDTATLRFNGTRLRFHGVRAPNHGRATISIDGVEQTVIDQYAPTRVHGELAWESPRLPAGEHLVTVTVVGERDERSGYVWVNVDRVEIDD